jgi:hypothetical protein
MGASQEMLFNSPSSTLLLSFFSVRFLVSPFARAGGVRRIGTESLSERASSSTETERNNRLSSSKTQKSPSIFERKAGENKPSSEKQEKINQGPYFFRKSTKCVEVQTPRCTNFSFAFWRYLHDSPVWLRGARVSKLWLP